MFQQKYKFKLENHFIALGDLYIQISLANIHRNYFLAKSFHHKITSRRKVLRIKKFIFYTFLSSSVNTLLLLSCGSAEKSQHIQQFPSIPLRIMRLSMSEHTTSKGHLIPEHTASMRHPILEHRTRIRHPTPNHKVSVRHFIT